MRRLWHARTNRRIYAMKKNKRLEFLALIPENTKKLLDLGCADGRATAPLRDKGVEVVGVEKMEHNSTEKGSF